MLFVVTETQKILFEKYTKFEVLHDALIIYDEEKIKGYFKTSNIVGFYVKKDAERGNINKTIENLNKLKSFHNGSYGADIDNAIKALKQQPRWIPCSERLPEENITVIGTTNFSDIYKVELYDDCGKKKWYADANFDVPIVAWMSLSQPYTESEEV